MKAIARAPFFATRRTAALLGPCGAAAMLLLSSCVPAPSAPPPKAMPAPAPRPVPRPAPAAMPQPTDWRDLPLTPGAWRWSLSGGISQAQYGVEGAAPHIIMACQNGQVRLTMPGIAAGGGVVQITTATMVRQASAQSDSAGAALTLPGNDRLLDAIALTRGRWQVEVATHAPLLLPADASASRVVEDCRAAR